MKSPLGEIFMKKYLCVAGILLFSTGLYADNIPETTNKHLM